MYVAYIYLKQIPVIIVHFSTDAAENFTHLILQKIFISLILGLKLLRGTKYHSYIAIKKRITKIRGKQLLQHSPQIKDL